MFSRSVNIPKNNSFFLFGARGTGKSTLLQVAFTPGSTLTYNLLDPLVEQRLLADVSLFQREVLQCGPEITHVIVDEIQKLPALLDSIHNLIETHKVAVHFVMTSSSARKLKLGGANLLGRRAVLRELFPLTSSELGAEFEINSALQFGTLPKIINAMTEGEKNDFLRAYGHVYLKEEVWAEQLVRKLDPFRRFLEVAASQSGKIVNYSSIAKDSGTNDNSIRTWYTILEDTLVGFHLESFHTSVRKQLRQSPKFYFFDTGVSRALAQMLTVKPNEKTSYYGDLFEQFVICEVYARNRYEQMDYRLCYLLTKGGQEIDLVIQRPGKALALVEIKSTTAVKESLFSTLLHFEKDFPGAEFFLLSQDPRPQRIGKIVALPWWKGIAQL